MKTSLHKKQFGQQAKDYQKYRKPYTPKLARFIFSLINNNQSKLNVSEGNKKIKILDLGCGTGKSTVPLLSKTTKLVGMDHDANMIAEARREAKAKKQPVTYVVGEAEKIPFDRETFDVVISGTAFHWFVNKKAMKEINRVLLPGGLLCVFWVATTEELDRDAIPGEFFRKYKWGRVPPHLRELKFIQQFFTDNGFNKIGTEVIPYQDHDTVADRVGLMKTASAYGLLSLEDKKKFVAELKKMLTEKLGTRKHFITKEEIQICWGFKKSL